MYNGASPQPDEACVYGLASVWAEGLRPGLKAVHDVTVHSPLAAVGWPLPAEPQPEPIMTLPRTAAQVLSGHVRLEVRCIDRVLLTFRQPRIPVSGSRTSS
jgi:hypothetical protein